MYRYKKILVAMDLDENNVSCVKFASRISHLAESEEVHFYYVTDEHDIPEKLCSMIDGDRTCETIVARMKETVEKHWDGFGKAKLSFDASQGHLLKDILSYIKQKDIDLVIVEKVCCNAKIPERLARKAPCSLVLVPPGFEPTMRKIFVAVDFSQYSDDALEKATTYAKAVGADKVTCVHVYSVPAGYYKSGHTYEEFAEILKKNAREDYEKMLGRVDVKGVKIEFIVEMNDHPYQGIADIVHGNGADLLVVGSRGRSKTGAILLGSVTERLIEVCNVPILTVKKKGEGLKFIEAMFGI